MGRPAVKKELPTWKKMGGDFSQFVEIQVGKNIVKVRSNTYGRPGRSLLLRREIWEQFKTVILENFVVSNPV
jgi:hypothetical protein